MAFAAFLEDTKIQDQTLQQTNPDVSKASQAVPQAPPESVPGSVNSPPTNPNSPSSNSITQVLDFDPSLVGIPGDFLPMFVELFDPERGVEQVIPFDAPSGKIFALKLRINPTSQSVNLSTIINRNQSMVGWIETHWGEELDTVTFQGMTGAFIYAPGNEGLTAVNRRDTITLKDFKNVVDVFRKNGLFYDDLGLISKRYMVRLSYDYFIYEGYFESIDITEEDPNPYRFSYTITFKSEYTTYKQRPRDADTLETSPGIDTGSFSLIGQRF